MKKKIAGIFFVVLFLNWALSFAFTSRSIRAVLKTDESPQAKDAGEVILYDASYALVIGINSYKNWPVLSGAVKDAELISEVLEKRGFDVTLETDLDDRQLKNVFEEFFVLKGENPNARLFVWFSGHGYSENGEGFLIPANAPRPENGGQFRLKAMSMRRFGELVRLAKSKHVLAIFDSCFSGTIFSTQRSIPPLAITRATTRPVRQFITSGDANEEVSDNGDFRKIFIRSLQNEEPADLNKDGYLTGSELGMFLTNRFVNLTQGSQTPRYGKLRDPDYDRGDFVFDLVRLDDHIASPQKDAILSVEASVPNAMVYIDGILVGESTLTGINVKPGKHWIKIEKSGYAPYEKEITFEPGKPESVFVHLNRFDRDARLYVETDPKTATIDFLNYDDPFYQGIKLPPGRYYIQISAENHETKRLWISLSENEDKNVGITLIRELTQETYSQKEKKKTSSRKERNAPKKVEKEKAHVPLSF